MLNISVSSFAFKLDGSAHFFEDLSRCRKIYWSLGVGHCKMQSSIDHLFDITASLDLTRVPAILPKNCRLVGHILQPMNEPTSVSAELKTVLPVLHTPSLSREARHSG